MQGVGRPERLRRRESTPPLKLLRRGLVRLVGIQSPSTRIDGPIEARSRSGSAPASGCLRRRESTAPLKLPALRRSIPEREVSPSTRIDGPLAAPVWAPAPDRSFNGAVD